MGRSDKRRDAARIKQQQRRIARAGGLTTALVSADADLSTHEHFRLYSGGIAQFRRQPSGAMKCIGENCETTFGTGADSAPAAWLLATAPAEPTSSSVSGICRGCYSRSLADIEADCARTLSRFAPSGEFEPLEVCR